MTERKPKATRPSKNPSAKLRASTKSAQIVELLARANGASIRELMKATGWQAHSVRGFMAGSLKRQGRSVTSAVDNEGERRYQLAVSP